MEDRNAMHTHTYSHGMCKWMQTGCNSCKCSKSHECIGLKMQLECTRRRHTTNAANTECRANACVCRLPEMQHMRMHTAAVVNECSMCVWLDMRVNAVTSWMHLMSDALECTREMYAVISVCTVFYMHTECIIMRCTPYASVLVCAYMLFNAAGKLTVNAP